MATSVPVSPFNELASMLLFEKPAQQLAGRGDAGL